MFSPKGQKGDSMHETNLRDGDLVQCGKCGGQAKVRVFDPGKIVLIDPNAMVSMRKENIALKCQNCGFVICFSCVSSQTGAIGVTKCPACNIEAGPYFFTTN